MFVRRFYDDRLAQASYLIACQQSGDAIVIDPARDVAPYLAAARAEHLRITRVTETHIHADFVSGARELAAVTGAALLLSGEGSPDWQYRYPSADCVTLLHNGDTIMLGGVRLDVWHTPGHTPEHLAFLVTDTERSDEPVAMVTGDFVFVGDVGRPDLLEKTAGAHGTAEKGARQLFASLARLAPLPDHLQIWPGHGAGSACGKALGALPTSTLGYERRTNWAFGAETPEAFVTAILEGQPEAPRYFGRMKQINRDGPHLIGAGQVLPYLPIANLAGAVRDGVVLDVRDAAMYADAHLPGSLNISLNRSFTKWAGSLLPYDRDIYLVALDGRSALQAQRALAAIGIDRLGGVFGPDVETGLPRRAQLTPPTRRVPIAQTAALHAAGRRIIDLRNDDEWAAGHFDVAEHHPLATLPDAVASLDRATPLAVHCQGGGRSAIAASLLEQMGFTDVVDLADGWGAVGK